MIQTQDKSNLPVYLLIGFFQGLVGYLGTTYWPNNNQLLQSLILGLITGIAVTGLAFQLVLSNRLEKYVQIFAVGLGLLYASIAIWLIYQFPEKAQSNTWANVITASWVFSSVLLAYILFPFIQSWTKRQNNYYNYSDLYEHSWDNFFVFLVAGLLTGVYWLLIVLWAMLFKMLGITLFVDLFFSAPFAWLTLPVVFSLGIRIGRGHENIIGTLRQIALSLCHLLMPLTALITILFAISLPFTGLKPIWDTGYSTPILLCLLGANILFINGVFQDGLKGNPYNLLVSRVVETSLILMPVYTLITIYSIYLRIDQYGFTPKRVYLTLLVLVAFCYSISYSWAVLKSTDVWLSKIKPANTVIALFISILIVLIHSPILNPVTWSAKNQFKRLVSGQVSPSEFDFGALKFQLGSPGHKYLQKLRDIPDKHPLKEKISGLLLAVDEVESYSRWKTKIDKVGFLTKNARVEAIIADNALPKGFINDLPLDKCKESVCFFLSVDLNLDKHVDVILFDMTNHWGAPTLYAQDENMHWVERGQVGHSMSKEKRKSLVEDIKKEGFQLIDPTYLSFQVGNEILNFIPSVGCQ
jgi:hypothetical protein